MYRKLCSLALVISALACTAAAAEVPLCATNTGTPGGLIVGQFGTVTAPVTFDRVTANDPSLTPFADIRLGDQMLVLAGGAVGLTTLTFYSGPSIQHKCTVEPLPFDAAKHDLAALMVGQCDPTTRGIPAVLTGHLHVVQMAEPFAELSAAPAAIMDASVVTDRQITLTGKALGLATLVWIRDDAQAALGGVCPYMVQTAADYFAKTGLVDGQLCRDTAGLPLRLKVGQSAKIATLGKAKPRRAYQAVRIGAEAIAQLSPVDEVGQTVTVTGVATGTTSIVMPHAAQANVQTCVIVVE